MHECDFLLSAENQLSSHTDSIHFKYSRFLRQNDNLWLIKKQIWKNTSSLFLRNRAEMGEMVHQVAMVP